ncbi:LysR family transcriptional regulator [Acinetobacter pittii]|nr:LysR family transcriptional regulator [Acinetobacter pittii]
MDYFGALRAFVYSAELRSFTDAGRKLGTTSSAIGKSIAKLENELGVSLFHRSTRAITLTAEGQLFLERSQRILSEFDVAKIELAQTKSAPKGKLRVGFPQFGIHLMHKFTKFQKLYPEIELELSFSDQLVNIIEDGFDIVIRVGEVIDSRLKMRHLISYQHLLVASPLYLTEYGLPTQPADLIHHKCLHYQYPTSKKLVDWPLVDINGVANNLPISIISDTIEPLQTMAEAGLGVALLPDFMIKNSIENGKLTIILENYIKDIRSVYILWPSSKQTLPKIKVFIDYMINTFGESFN